MWIEDVFVSAAAAACMEMEQDQRQTDTLTAGTRHLQLTLINSANFSTQSGVSCGLKSSPDVTNSHYYMII